MLGKELREKIIDRVKTYKEVALYNDKECEETFIIEKKTLTLDNNSTEYWCYYFAVWAGEYGYISLKDYYFSSFEEMINSVLRELEDDKEYKVDDDFRDGFLVE